MRLLELPIEVLVSIWVVVLPEDISAFAATCKTERAYGEKVLMKHQSLIVEWSTVDFGIRLNMLQGIDMLETLFDDPVLARYIRTIRMEGLEMLNEEPEYRFHECFSLNLKDEKRRLDALYAEIRDILSEYPHPVIAGQTSERLARLDILHALLGNAHFQHSDELWGLEMAACFMVAAFAPNLRKPSLLEASSYAHVTRTTCKTLE